MRIRLAFVMSLLALVGCGHKLPPANRLMEPGPGVGGPGPGVIPPDEMGMAMGGGPVCQIEPSQVHFVGPDGLHIQMDVGSGTFDSDPLVAPALYNFGQGAIYRLKLTQIPGYEGKVLYPTLEVAPVLPKTAAYLSHNAIPVQFTQEDFDQVLTGNFVTKVIYLPDAEYQELAIAGVETLVSTRLDPGVDPVVEADRRGSILGIIRIGNKSLEAVAGEEAAVVGGEFAMGPGGFPAGGMGGPYTPYGMPITGTPIGLPGPPHIPLGSPAGLNRHVMTNHTHMHLPKPTQHMHISAKERGLYSYPVPPNHLRISEGNRHHPGGLGGANAGGGAGAADCAPY